MSTPPNADARALMDVAKWLAEAGDVARAITIYQQAYQVAEPNSSVQIAIEYLITSLSSQTPRPPATPTPGYGPTVVGPGYPGQTLGYPPPAPGYPPQTPGYAGQMPGYPPQAPGYGGMPVTQPVRTARPQTWTPLPKAPSRASLLGTLVLVSLAVAVAVYVSMRLASDQLAVLSDGLLLGGAMLFQAVRNGMLAAIAGAVQVWRLRELLTMERRILFVVAGLVGGVTGGLLAGLLGQMSIYPASAWQALLAGGIVGLEAGTISSLIHRSLLRDFRRGPYWITWNAGTWLVIWSIGYLVGWLVGGTAGAAAACVVIIVGTGIAMSAFLWLTPDIEF